MLSEEEQKRIPTHVLFLKTKKKKTRRYVVTNSLAYLLTFLSYHVSDRCRRCCCFAEHRQALREPLGAKTVGQQQDDGRDEAAQRFHVPPGDGRAGGRGAEGAVQPVPAVRAAEGPRVPADRRRGRQEGRRRRGHGGVRGAARGRRGQADGVQAVAGRRRVPGRAARAQVRRVLLPGRGQQTAREGRQAQVVIACARLRS